MDGEEEKEEKEEEREEEGEEEWGEKIEFTPRCSSASGLNSWR